MKILFCDIDKTLTETISGAPLKQHPKDVKIIDGADKGLKHFSKLGWLIIGISNQGGVAAGHKSLEDAIAEMAYTKVLLPELRRIYFCPDYEGKQLFSDDGYQISAHEDCSKYNFRKPNPGMINHFLDDVQIRENFKKWEAWMIGDRPEDEQCAANAGINFCPASVFHARFTTGMKEVNTTPQIIEFLEGIKIY